MGHKCLKRFIVFLFFFFKYVLYTYVCVRINNLTMRRDFFRLFMQIMECCYYLNNSARVTKNEDKGKGKIEEGSNFVRLLTGSRMLSNLMDVDVAIPNDKPLRQQPFNMAVVKKSTGKVDILTFIFSLS